MGLYLVTSGLSGSVTLTNIADVSASASAERFNARWIYHIPAASGVGQQRRVIKSGFVPSTGQLSNELIWSVTPVLLDEIEMTSLFPCGEHPTQTGGVSGEDTSYNALINRALSMIVAPDRVGLAITTDQFYSTATWVNWLDREERLIRVLEPGVRGGLPHDAAWRGITLRLDAETPGLEVRRPFSSASGTLYLDVLRPADTWVATSGVWAEAMGGMTNNLQEVKATVNDVVKVARMLAIEALMARSPGRPAGNWAARYPQAVRDARSVRWYDTGQESAQAQAIPSETAAA